MHVNVNIGAPPSLCKLRRPWFIWRTGFMRPLGFRDIFFFSGRYYYLRGNNWFWAGAKWTVDLCRIPKVTAGIPEVQGGTIAGLS